MAPDSYCINLLNAYMKSQENSLFSVCKDKSYSYHDIYNNIIIIILLDGFYLYFEKILWIYLKFYINWGLNSNT